MTNQSSNHSPSLCGVIIIIVAKIPSLGTQITNIFIYMGYFTVQQASFYSTQLVLYVITHANP